MPPAGQHSRWRVDLKDEQWAVIEPLLPKPHRHPDGRGRPRVDDRAIMNGILWTMRTGAPWQDMPDRYPSPATCHRRFQSWVESGAFERILEALAKDLRDRGKLDLSECFIDGTFVVAKKGGSAWERPSGAKVRSSWQWQTVLAFQSRPALPVLRRMKSPLYKPLLMRLSFERDLFGSSETPPTTRTRSTKRLPSKASR